MLENTSGGDCCIVEVRTSRGIDDLRGEPVVGRAIGVMGALGLCSLFTVVKEGLKAGVCGEGAANEHCEAVEVE
jgi:hypothetical protein